MKRLQNFLIVFLALIAAHTAWPQAASERALYDFMGRERLTTTNGPRSVEWLPHGNGYLLS